LTQVIDQQRYHSANKSDDVARKDWLVVRNRA
jgi:hypothetical protein